MPETGPEHEPLPRDISQEFLSMPSHEFHDFLRTLRGEQSLIINVPWTDMWAARSLKSFLEDPNKPRAQMRKATIRATEAQHNGERNVFASGVHWERVEPKNE